MRLLEKQYMYGYMQQEEEMCQYVDAWFYIWFYIPVSSCILYVYTCLICVSPVTQGGYVSVYAMQLPLLSN